MVTEPSTRALRNNVLAYFEKTRHALDDIYTWKIATWPVDLPFERGTDSLARANMRLKRVLHAEWQNGNYERRYDIAQYYVGKWGGVKRNKPETLLDYATAAEEALLDKGIQGIASWSKVIVVRDPTRYAIFDARVATSLNALQILEQKGHPILFPNLTNQNRTIREFQKWLRAREHWRVHYLPKASVYQTYLEVLREVAVATDLESLDEIEMVLFANAEILAREAMAIS